MTEIFHSIQGESTFAGRPCVFVRLSGCPLRCSWCDTAYAFHGGMLHSIEDVVKKVRGYACPLVEVTGGEPLAQAGCRPLLAALEDEGHQVLLETSGALSIEGVDPRTTIVMDLKCPSSMEGHRNLWDNLKHLKPTDEVKFVVATRQDYEWARDVARERKLAETNPVLFSPVHGVMDGGHLARWVLDDHLPVRVQVQLHKILFGDRPGV